MNLGVAFIIGFIIYLAVMFLVSYKNRMSTEGDTGDYVLGGRQISLIVNIFGVCAIGFSGSSISRATDFAIRYGLPGFFAWCLSYSIVGLALYGLLFGGTIRRCGSQTIAEWTEVRYGKNVRLIVTLVSIFGTTSIMASNLTAVASNLSSYTGWNKIVCLSGAFLLVLCIAYFSGMWGITATDFVQMCLGLVGGPLLAILLFQKFGFFGYVASNWPASSLMVGTLETPISFGAITYPSVLTLALPFLVWGNNYYWVRVASCRNEKTAKWSYVIGAVILVIMIYIPLGLSGCYAFTSNPKVFQDGTVATSAAFGYIVAQLMPLLSVIFMLAVVAASVSTATTAHIGAVSTATRDVYQRRVDPNASGKQVLRFTKVMMIVVAVAAYGLAFYPGGAVYLLPFASAWMGPVSILVLLGVFWPRFNKNGAMAGLVAGLITMTIVTLLPILGIKITWIYSGMAGTIVTIVFCIIGTLVTAPNYYAKKGWTVSADSRRAEKVELEEMDRKILYYLFSGAGTMAEITDLLQVDSFKSNAAIERLDKNGCIEREGLRGAKFYSFRITEKGIAMLSSINERDKELSKYGLNEIWFDVLCHSSLDMNQFGEYLMSVGISSLTGAAIISILVRNGYVREYGTWKRQIAITDKGHEIIRKMGANK